jgi:hypothetical protein
VGFARGGVVLIGTGFLSVTARIPVLMMQPLELCLPALVSFQPLEASLFLLHKGKTKKEQ